MQSAPDELAFLTLVQKAAKNAPETAYRGDMTAFDKLARPVRALLNDAPWPLCPWTVLAFARDHHLHGAELARGLKRAIEAYQAFFRARAA